MNNSKKSVLNILTGVFGQVVTIGIGILLPRLFIVSYGSETNGFLSSVNTLVSYLALLEAGVGAATVQALYGPIGDSNRSRINAILAATDHFYKRTGLAYGVIIVCLAILYPLLVPSELDHLLQVAIILLVGSSGVLGYLFQAKFKLLLQAEGKQYVITNITTAIQVCTSVGKLTCMSIGVSILGLQVFQFLLVLVQIACYCWYIRKNYWWIDLSVTPDEEAISQKNSVLVHQVAEMVFNNVDVVILTLLVGDLRVVSVYSLYNMLVDMISTLIGNVNTGFVFRLGQLYNSSRGGFNRVFNAYETFFMAFSFALYTVTYLFIWPFMALYTAGVEDANYLLPLLPLLFVTYKLLVCGRGACGTLASYAGHFRETRAHSIIETSINLLTSIIAVIVCQNLWGLGIYGVLIGTICALLYRANVMILYANRRILFRSSWMTYRKWLLDVAVTIACVAVYRMINPQIGGYVQLLACATLTGIATVGLFFVVNAVFERDGTAYILGYIRVARRSRQ